MHCSEWGMGDEGKWDFLRKGNSYSEGINGEGNAGIKSGEKKALLRERLGRCLL